MADELMHSSLYIWLSRTFEELHPPVNLYELSDGEFLNKAMSNISPARFTMSRINKDVGEDSKCRIDNLNMLLKNVILYYEEILNCFMVAKLPDIRTIGIQPQSYITSLELEKMFTLMLGIAFQCENKNMYIEQAQQLPEDVQKDLMTKILEMTESNRVVFTNYLELNQASDNSLTNSLCHTLHSSLHDVVSERNDLHEKYIRTSQERDEYLAMQLTNRGRRSTISMNDSFNESRDGSRPTTPAYSVEVAELRTKILSYEDEMEAKADMIVRLREEERTSTEQIQKLRTEYRTLYDDAQAARIYRDEIDVLRCKAEKLDKYEADICKYRDKLEDMEYLKNRVKELKSNNDQLNEMNDLLKEELVNSEQINKAIIAEEEKNIKLRSLLEELSAQKDYGGRVIQDLTNQMKQLEMELKHSASMITQMQAEIDELTISNNEIRMALLERDDAPDSMKFVNIEKELSRDGDGDTPIINRRRSTIKENSRDDYSDMLSTKLKRLEMDNLHLKTQVENLKNTNAKLQMLEQGVEKDRLAITTSKTEIVGLQGDIVVEKNKTENLQSKLDEAYLILMEMGYDTNKLSEARPLSDREKFLKYEERLRQSLNHSLKMKEERICVLEDRVTENVTQNDGLRQELASIKKQNRGYQKKTKDLQETLDASLVSIQSKSPTRRISKGVQYEHALSLSSTPIKQRVSTALSPGGVNLYNISSIPKEDANKSPDPSNILDVSYDSVSLSESAVAFQLLRQDVVDLKDENDKLFLDKEQLEQDVQELQTERRGHLTEIQNLRQTSVDLKNETSDLEDQLKKLASSLEEIEYTCSSLEDLNEKLRLRCEEVEREKQCVNEQCNKLLMQNQQLLIKTMEEQERTREEQRVYQDQILNMKQNMTLAIQQHKDDATTVKKKTFFKQIFGKKKYKTKEDPNNTGPTPHIDEYLEQLSMESGDRLTPPDYDNGYYGQRDPFMDSNSSSRTMSGDGALERGSMNSLGRAPDTSHSRHPETSNSRHPDTSHTSSRHPDTSHSRHPDTSHSRHPDTSHLSHTSAMSYRTPGITRTLSTDTERRNNVSERDHTPRRHGSLRLKTKSESLETTPRIEPRSMVRPIPPGTHSTVVDHRPLSSLSVQSSSRSITGNVAPEQTQRSISAEPSAFRQYNTRHHDLSQPFSDAGYYADSSSEYRLRSSHSSVSDTYSQRGLHNEDTHTSSYYEYGCV